VCEVYSSIYINFRFDIQLVITSLASNFVFSTDALNWKLNVQLDIEIENRMFNVAQNVS